MLRLHTLLCLVFVAAATFCIAEAFPNPETYEQLRREYLAYSNRKFSRRDNDGEDGADSKKQQIYEIPPRNGLLERIGQLCLNVDGLDVNSKRMCELYNTFSVKKIENIDGIMPLVRVRKAA